VTPRAGVDSIDGFSDAGQLRVRVRAAPADGEANDALIRLIAAALDVPRSAVTIRRGATSRVKVVAIDGIDRDELARRWPALASSGRT